MERKDQNQGFSIGYKPKNRFLRVELIKSRISYQKELYQIEEVMAGKIVTVTERIDGTMRMYYQGRNLKFR